MVLKSFTPWMMLLIQLAAGMHRVDFSPNENMSHENDDGYINVYLKQSCHNQLNKHIRFQFPYVKFDRQQAPLFDSLKRVSESTTMFVDQTTKQTLFESSNQVYIVSSLMNFDEKIISLGELIINGYASLSNDHSPITSDFDITSYTVSDSHLDEDLPRYNYELNRFDDSIRTDYQTDFQEICEINMRVKRSYYQNKNYKKPDYYQPYRKSKYTKPCEFGFSLSSSGKCVNLLNDIKNCGSFGYVCPQKYKSCSGGICSVVSPIQITGGTTVSGWLGNYGIDDSNATISLPVALTLYNYSSNYVTVTSNGVVCLGKECPYEYENTNLPSDVFVNPAVMCFWDDLRLTYNTSQGVYYAVNGTKPNRQVILEYLATCYDTPTAYYHFQVIFLENQPNVVKCKYLDISDGGVSATIGVQSSPSGPAMPYSFNGAQVIVQGITIAFDTMNNGVTVTIPN